MPKSNLDILNHKRVHLKKNVSKKSHHHLFFYSFTNPISSYMWVHKIDDIDGSKCGGLKY